MNSKVALATARAELLYTQKHVPNKLWHLAAPVTTIGICRGTNGDIAALVIVPGFAISMITSAYILDRYDEEKKLLIKCAQLEAELKEMKD